MNNKLTLHQQTTESRSVVKFKESGESWVSYQGHSEHEHSLVQWVEHQTLAVLVPPNRPLHEECHDYKLG